MSNSGIWKGDYEEVKKKQSIKIDEALSSRSRG